MNPSSSVTPAFFATSCIGLGTEWHEQCDLRCSGIADPFADDLITGRGVVLGRAATKLRSIETQPLTGGSMYQIHTGYDSPPPVTDWSYVE